MRTSKFTFSYSRNLQMRRFETVSVFLSVETELEPGETLVGVAAKVKKQVKREVEDEILSLKRERRESVDDELEKSE